MTDFPRAAQVVIIGGGIVGCSIAYHLTLRGISDVVLLERKQLTSGTTWHAAGLVGQLSATHNLTRLAQYTAGLYATLEPNRARRQGFGKWARSLSPRMPSASRSSSAAPRWRRLLRPRGECAHPPRGLRVMAFDERRRSRRRRASAEGRPNEPGGHGSGARQGARGNAAPGSSRM